MYESEIPSQGSAIFAVLCGLFLICSEGCLIRLRCESEVRISPSAAKIACRPMDRLPCTELAVPGVAQAGHDVADFVEALVHGCQVDVHVRVGFG